MLNQISRFRCDKISQNGIATSFRNIQHHNEAHAKFDFFSRLKWIENRWFEAKTNVSLFSWFGIFVSGWRYKYNQLKVCNYLCNNFENDATAKLKYFIWKLCWSWNNQFTRIKAKTIDTAEEMALRLLPIVSNKR